MRDLQHELLLPGGEKAGMRGFLSDAAGLRNPLTLPMLTHWAPPSPHRGEGKSAANSGAQS